MSESNIVREEDFVDSSFDGERRRLRDRLNTENVQFNSLSPTQKRAAMALRAGSQAKFIIENGQKTVVRHNRLSLRWLLTAGLFT